MAFTYSDHTGDGTTVAFPFTFEGEDYGYFDEDQVVVYLDEVEQTTGYSLTSPNVVTFTIAPALDVAIRIRREVPTDKPYTDFKRGNAYGRNNINRSFLQQLYLFQEAYDGFKPDDYMEQQDLNMGGKTFINIGGSFSMSGLYYITDIPDPINDQDAATKGWVYSTVIDEDATGTATAQLRADLLDKSYSKGSDLIANVIKEVPLVSDLLTTFGYYSGQSAQPLGYSSIGDGGGGPARVWADGELPGTYVNKDASVLVPGDGSAAWVMPPQTSYNPKWFGAKGDAKTDGTGTDDREALQRLFDFLEDGMSVNGGGCEYGYSTTSIDLTHTTDENGTNVRNYPRAALVIKLLDRISVNLTFTEIFDPSTEAGNYQVCLLQDVVNSSFNINFKGNDATVLNDSMVTATNPLESKGAEVMVFLDNCKSNTLDGTAKQARVLGDMRSYEPVTYDFFTEVTRPTGLTGTHHISDSKYGFRNEAGNNTNIVIIGENCKRTYRIDGGSNHTGFVENFTTDKYSWDADSKDIIILGSGDVHSQNIHVNLHMYNKPSLVALENGGENSMVSNVTLNLHMLSGRLVFFNTRDTATTSNIWQDINITGSISTEEELPIRIWPIKNVGDTGSRLSRIKFHNLTVKSTAPSVVDFFRIEKLVGLSEEYLSEITLSNVKFSGSTDGVNQSSVNTSYINGALVFKNTRNLILDNVTHNLSGTVTSSDDTIVFEKCSAPTMINCFTPGNVIRDTCTPTIANFPPQTRIAGEVRIQSAAIENESYVKFRDLNGMTEMRLYNDTGPTIAINPEIGIRLAEMSAPAGVVDHGIIYTRNNSGKTQLVVQFGTGTPLVIAAEV